MATIDIVEFHTFVASGLPIAPIVIDLGANKGAFSRKMHERYDARCIAVEADPNLYARLIKGGFEAHHFAIADRSGTISFNTSKIDRAGSIVASDGKDAVEVPCVDLMSFVDNLKLPRIDLIKVDIEGAELDVFRACTDDFLRSIPQMTVEFHDFCGISTAQQIEECLDRFLGLGFDHIRMSRVGHQDTLLVNRALVPLTSLEFGWAKYGTRNIKGAERVARKLLLGKNWAKDYS